VQNKVCDRNSEWSEHVLITIFTYEGDYGGYLSIKSKRTTGGVEKIIHAISQNNVIMNFTNNNTFYRTF